MIIETSGDQFFQDAESDDARFSPRVKSRGWVGIEVEGEG